MPDTQSKQEIQDNHNQFETIEQFGSFVQEVLGILTNADEESFPTSMQMDCLVGIDTPNYKLWRDTALGNGDGHAKFPGFNKVATIIALTTPLVWGHTGIDNFFTIESQRAYLAMSGLKYAFDPLIYVATLGHIFRNTGGQKLSEVSRNVLGLDRLNLDPDYLGFVSQTVRQDTPKIVEMIDSKACLFLTNIDLITSDLINLGLSYPSFQDIQSLSSYLKSDRCKTAIELSKTILGINLASIFKTEA